MVKSNIVPFPQKMCSKCLEYLPLSEFYARTNRPGKKASICKKCHNEYMLDRYHNVPEVKKKRREWMRRTSGRKVGVDVKDIDKWYDEQLKKQDGKCAMLDCRLPVEKNLHSRFARDHSKATGKFRALLCNRCNLQLGHYQNRQAAFEVYLEKYGR